MSIGILVGVILTRETVIFSLDIAILMDIEKFNLDRRHLP